MARHLGNLCARAGLEIELTTIDPTLLRDLGRTVAGRLGFVNEHSSTYDIVFVHRDAEAQDPQLRRDEVAAGAREAGIACPTVPVIPVKMTEAWLLLDEAAIRRVAGRPNGTIPLELPTMSEAERLADPKRRLKTVLLTASETSGRRRKQFERDFGRHRALLLEQLSTEGPVAGLAAWQRLRSDIGEAIARLDAAGP